MMFLNILFFLSALLTIVSAILVATTKNIMHACIFLLGSLLGVAGLYITLNADFIAAVQIMVYVGGVVILMLFAVMLTGGKEFMDNVKMGLHREPFMGSFKTYIWGGLCSIVLLGSLYQMLSHLHFLQNSESIAPFGTSVEKIGMSLLTDHVLAFEFSSILLLGALIGAAIIARPRLEKQD